jgi:hypothetical protein
MRHGEILTRIIIPYLFNYPLLLGSWQGQPLVSLHKLTKTESLQILGGVGLLPFTPVSALRWHSFNHYKMGNYYKKYSLSSHVCGSLGRGGGDRTHDLRLKRPLLYH